MVRTGLACVIFSVVLLAADVSGKWQGTLTDVGDDMQLTLDLKQDGSTITGKISNADVTLDLQDGKIADGTVTFSVLYHDQTFRFELKANDGGGMAGTMRGKGDDGTPMTGKITLKRA